MGKLRSIARLSLADHTAFVEAVLSMVWARVVIASVPMRYWQGQIGTGDSSSENQMDDATIVRVARAIARVGRNSPVDFLCLTQALAAHWMLRRRGIKSNLFIGTHKYARSGEPHKFHAWLKIDERWITGRCNEQDYATFARESRSP